MTAWIPVSVSVALTATKQKAYKSNMNGCQILCVMPYDIVRWILVAVAFGVTGESRDHAVEAFTIEILSNSLITAMFLIRNLYAIISRADAKTSRLLLIGILAGHAIFAVVLKLSFYSNDFRQAANDTPAGTNPTV